ncbi:MAG TPA: mannosyltransferase family protein [Ktedonobacterales bacterium]|nr:mannosyltransferase family protein [Ktedonobacterales bacterium]
MSVFPEQQVRSGLRPSLDQVWKACLTWSHRHDVRAALLATLALRVVCSSLAALLTFVVSPAHVPPSFLGKYVINPWLHWDTLWYLAIAEHGYSGPGSTAFMPLYPLLMRALGTLLGGNLPLAALVISTCATFGALLCLHRLVSRWSAVPHAADWALVTAVMLPVSFFLMAGYSEALFVWLSLATILLALEERWALVAGVSALAALTRHQGVFLPLVFLPGLCFQAREWWRSREQGEPWQDVFHVWFWPLLAVLAGPATYLLWWLGVVGLWLHAPLPWGPEILPNGWYLHSAVPGAGIWANLVALAQNKVPNPLGLSLPLDTGMAVLAGLGILLAIRRFPPGLLLYLIACWCLALLKVQTAGLTISTARYLLPLLPLLLLPAELLAGDHRLLRLAWVGVGGVLLVFYTWLFAWGVWIA